MKEGQDGSLKHHSQLPPLGRASTAGLDPFGSLSRGAGSRSGGAPAAAARFASDNDDGSSRGVRTSVDVVGSRSAEPPPGFSADATMKMAVAAASASAAAAAAAAAAATASHPASPGLVLRDAAPSSSAEAVDSFPAGRDKKDDDKSRRRSVDDVCLRNSSAASPKEQGVAAVLALLAEDNKARYLTRHRGPSRC